MGNLNIGLIDTHYCKLYIKMLPEILGVWVLPVPSVEVELARVDGGGQGELVGLVDGEAIVQLRQVGPAGRRRWGSGRQLVWRYLHNHDLIIK